MKLSTAILKGSKGKRQSFETLIDSNGDVCALGAACLGVGIKPKVGAYSSPKLLKMFPYLGRITNNYIYNPKTLADKIIIRNDKKRWNFKRIASWLRQLGF